MLRMQGAWGSGPVLAAVLVLVLGCGGDAASPDEGSPDGEGILDTGLDPSLPLNEVDGDQARQACLAFRQAVEDNYDSDTGVQRGCEAFGAGSASEENSCQTFAQACVSQVNEGTNPFFSRETFELELPSCDGDVSRFQSCSRTVGELEQCVQDRFAGFQALLDEATCPNAASVSLLDVMAIASYWDSVGPASCVEFEAECPEVIRF